MPYSGFGSGAHDTSYERITRIQDGMDVVDAAGEHIGNVAGIRIGDPDAVDIERGEYGTPGEGFALAMGAHREPNVPPALVDRLLREGYIKIDDKRRFRRDHHYYATADQIASVDANTVRLDRVSAELIPALDD
jgi:hypothetical protein